MIEHYGEFDAHPLFTNDQLRSMVIGLLALSLSLTTGIIIGVTI